jgi:hypothetical protein
MKKINQIIEEIKNNKLSKFWIFLIIILLICTGIILFFAIKTVTDDYNNYVSIPNLILTFIGCFSALFFSLATYLNLNFSKEKKKEKDIIENYSLINFCSEVTVLEKTTIENKDYTRVCFLVTESVKCPVYKVFFNKIKVKDKEPLNIEIQDGKYCEDILDRKYNCLEVLIPLSIEKTKELFKPKLIIEIELDIVSIFKVQSTVNYQLMISKEKTEDNKEKNKKTKGKNKSENTDNPDKKEYPNLSTFLLHSSIYTLENQSIYDRK